MTTLPHAPLGANASLSFGPPPGEVGLALADQPFARRGVYLGCRTGSSAPWNLLPLFTPHPTGPQPLPKGRYGRFLAAAGDKWMIGPLVFKLCTPFPLTAAGADERVWYVPVLSAYLEYDNTHNLEPSELIFGFGGAATPLPTTECTGFQLGEHFAYATPTSSEVTARQDRDLCGQDVGAASGLHFAVPAQSKRIFPLTLGFFQPAFFYTRFLSTLTEVIRAGLSLHAELLARADAIDTDFMRSSAPFAEKTAAAEQLRCALSRTRRLRDDPPVDLSPIHSVWTGMAAPR